ncbi:MAG: hypothetical protein JW715_13685 [Sedimentisphaerales bacterium]|nr:hypothetical protein [Sedimentisphaerales bacterium]
MELVKRRWIKGLNWLLPHLGSTTTPVRIEDGLNKFQFAAESYLYQTHSIVGTFPAIEHPIRFSPAFVLAHFGRSHPELKKTFPAHI